MAFHTASACTVSATSCTRTMAAPRCTLNKAAARLAASRSSGDGTTPPRVATVPSEDLRYQPYNNG